MSQIEHPVMAPTTLTSCAHGIYVQIYRACSHRSLAWNAGSKPGCRTTTSDFLGDAVPLPLGYPMVVCRPHRFPNFHLPHRRRKVVL